MPSDQLMLFDLPPPDDAAPPVSISGIRVPIWTEHKAKLIERYLYYFVLITKHGTYIDGFAGPQEPDRPDMWAAKLVLESNPRWLRSFHLCELDGKKVHALQELRDSQPPRDTKKKEPKRLVDIIQGDFNSSVDSVLQKITKTEATFCLLDQRTFECRWSTVAALAHHKAGNRKIELFYFLPIKWLQRALAAQQDLSVIQAWWGRDDWESLRESSNDDIRRMVCERFKHELGYSYALAFPIYERTGAGGSVMYYMVHATDHPEGPNLMSRAYRQATAAKEPAEQFQLELEEWRAREATYANDADK